MTIGGVYLNFCCLTIYLRGKFPTNLSSMKSFPLLEPNSAIKLLFGFAIIPKDSKPSFCSSIAYIENHSCIITKVVKKFIYLVSPSISEMKLYIITRFKQVLEGNGHYFKDNRHVKKQCLSFEYNMLFFKFSLNVATLNAKAKLN